MELEIKISETDEMSEQTDFLEYVGMIDAEGMPEMLTLRAIPSLLQTVRRHDIDEFNQDALKTWTADMLAEGLKLSTVKRYTGALHTLYKVWALESGTGTDTEDSIFSLKLPAFDAEQTRVKIKETEANLALVDRLIKISVKPDSPLYIYNKAFQYLLFNPGTGIRDIIKLKYSDARPDSLHIEDIVTSMRKVPQAQYVFPLQQGKRRDGAIVKDLLADLHATAKRVGLKFEGSFSRESITSIWIAAANREGIPYGEIRALLPSLPATYAFLELIPTAEISEERKTDIINKVAYSITNKNPGWFVLRLRSKVIPDMIKERLKEKESPLQRQIEYYYPLKTIKKIEKKVAVPVQVPVLPGILFFRMPSDRVTQLVGTVGDLAWCYRTTANPSSPYSVIPQKEMRIFQKSVGSLTKDVEMDIISELPALKVGDEVVIDDGSILDGQLATIRKVKSKDGSVTYTLRLSDTAFIKWEDINLPATHIVAPQPPKGGA